MPKPILARARSVPRPLVEVPSGVNVVGLSDPVDGLDPHQPVVVVGADAAGAASRAEWLAALGFGDVAWLDREAPCDR